MKELELESDGKMCSAAIFIRDQKILLGLRNYVKTKEMKTLPIWTTPGGRCDTGETLGEGLLREIREEVGMGSVEVIAYAGTYPSSMGGGDLVHAVLCQSDEDPRLMEPDKFSEWRWFSVHELPPNLISPHLEGIILQCIKGRSDNI